jgi:hypothetical protein
MPKEGFCDHSPIGGATEENLYCTADMGLVQADTTAITDAWRATMQEVFSAVVGAGGFAWQNFHSVTTPHMAQCASFFRAACSQGTSSQYYKSATVLQLTYNNSLHDPLPIFAEDLASFMLIRGPYAWIGYGWIGCSAHWEFRDEFKMDYGVPSNTCVEVSSGVFQREFSKATAKMDCNAYAGSMTMK